MIDWYAYIHHTYMRACFGWGGGGGGFVAVTTKPHQQVFLVALISKTNMSVFAYTKA